MHSWLTSSEKIRPPATREGKQPRTAHFPSEGRGRGCAAAHPVLVLPPAAISTAGQVVFCSLLSTTLGSFQMGVGQGAAGTPLQLLETSWLPTLSGAAAAAAVRAKLSCCSRGSGATWGCRSFAPTVWPSVDFVRCLLRWGQKPLLGKEGLAVYTGMPKSSPRKDPSVNSFLWNVQTDCELT